MDKTDEFPKFFGDLTITTTFSVDHPNYIGRYLRNHRIGDFVLLTIALGFATPVSFWNQELYFAYGYGFYYLAVPIILGCSIWIYRNERKIKQINQDLSLEPKEVEGMIKVERERTSPGHYPYPGGFCILEDDNTKYKVDVTFIRRMEKGYKVRLIYTPNLKFVQAWQQIR